ncbi:hypothetical protein BaRGS_00018108 [Batillaria attramentaria]|uniref:HTH CENPB-type domain-containing protein n=1 Tax=Batillaria attramentaria TaxID=370345 RepID=A0ABD0KTU9_9CAEN
MAEKVRQSLSLKRKFEIIDYVEKNPCKQRKTIATELSVPASTLSKIIKDKQKYLQQYETSKNPDMKRNRGPKLESVDTELLNWFAATRSQNIPVDGEMLKTKAEELAACSLSDWKCSDGWLHRWKKRHGISFKAVSGERACVDEEVTDAWVQNVLLPTLRKYEAQDVYNVDETTE